MWPTTVHDTQASVDVHVDGFLLMALMASQKGRVLRHTTLSSINDVLRPLEEGDPACQKEHASIKKMQKDNAYWSTRTRILGWDFDTQAGTLQLPLHRLESLYKLLDHLNPP